MDGDRLRLHANRNCYRLSRVSCALLKFLVIYCSNFFLTQFGDNENLSQKTLLEIDMDEITQSHLTGAHQSCGQLVNNCILTYQLIKLSISQNFPYHYTEWCRKSVAYAVYVNRLIEQSDGFAVMCGHVKHCDQKSKCSNYDPLTTLHCNDRS